MTWETIIYAIFGPVFALFMANRLALIATNLIELRRAIRLRAAIQRLVEAVDRLERYRRMAGYPQRPMWALNSVVAARLFLCDDDPTWTQLGKAEQVIEDLEQEPWMFVN